MATETTHIDHDCEDACAGCGDDLVGLRFDNGYVVLCSDCASEEDTE